MTQSSSEPPFYGRTPHDGFCVLRKHWGHPDDIEAQAGWLAREFAVAVAGTKTPDRPARGKDFRIAKHGARRLDGEAMNEAMRERRLEYRLFRAYGLALAPRPEGVWRSLAGYQVPLYDHRRRNGWGHVDLLGLSEDGSPVTIELKVVDPTYSPFRALLEVLANAVAVRAVWPSIAREIATASERVPGRPVRLDACAQKFAVQVLAPDDYWAVWQPTGARGKTVTLGARDAVAELRRVARDAGFPVHFGALTEESENSFVCQDVGSDW